MGSVWLADHLSLQSQVAVKFMAPSMADDQTSVRRFQQEAKAAAEIRSPHVVQVFDHGQTDDGQLFIVMELLEGESLEKRVRRVGALRPSQVARMVAQVCKALAKAHERGIVHRDIKPSNVFVIDSGGDEFIKLLDFGVAKFSGEEAVNMTAAGNMVGTPAFMSPEQLFHGRDIDHRGDLWSVAVVAYFALTGARPFGGKTLGELAVQIKGAKFRAPSELRNDLPPDVDAWFARALHPDLTARFSTAKEMGQVLEMACGVSSLMASTPSGVANQLHTFPGTALSSSALPIPTRRDRRVPMAIGVGVAMALVGGVAAFVLLGGASGAAATGVESSSAASAAAATSDAQAAEPDTEPSPDEPPPEEPVEEPLARPASSAPPASSSVAPASPSPVRPRDAAQPRPVDRPKPDTDDRLKDAADRLGI